MKGANRPVYTVWDRASSRAFGRVSPTSKSSIVSFAQLTVATEPGRVVHVRAVALAEHPGGGVCDRLDVHRGLLVQPAARCRALCQRLLRRHFSDFGDSGLTWITSLKDCLSSQNYKM
jgi:hypothetical protein